jgi:hypothetical protein
MDNLIFERDVQKPGNVKIFYFFINNTKIYNYPHGYSKVAEDKKPLLFFCF